MLAIIILIKTAQASRVRGATLVASAGKESTCNAGDPGLIPGLGRSAGEGIGYSLQYSWASLVAQLVKNPPAMRETWVQPLGWADPLAIHVSFSSSPSYDDFKMDIFRDLLDSRVVKGLPWWLRW